LTTNKSSWSLAKIIFLNQMAGPLFREMAEAVAERFPGMSLLVTGHPDTISSFDRHCSLQILQAPAYNRSSKWRRACSWLSYTVYASVLVIRSHRDALFVISSNPPILPPAMWLIGRIVNLRLVVVVHDLHPDVLVAFGHLAEGNPVARIWRRLNRLVWESADLVVTIGSHMARRIGSQHIEARTRFGRVLVLPPWADTDQIRPLSRDQNPLALELGLGAKRVVLYSGNLGISHDIDGLLEAARLLRARNDIHFLIIGAGEKWQDAQDFRGRHGLENLTILPFQPEERLPHTLSLADLSVVALDEGAEGLMLPSKTFYYMAAGSAILGICRGENDLAAVIEEADCGVTVPPRRPDVLSHTIELLLDDETKLQRYKKNARWGAERKYSKAKGPLPLIEAFEALGYLPTQDFSNDESTRIGVTFCAD